MFEEAAAHVASTLANDSVIGRFTILRNTVDRYDDRLKQALREEGIALVVIALAGNNASPSSQLLVLRHEIKVAVIENPTTNTSGETLLGIVERVLSIIHQSKPTIGLQNVIVADQPAYENASIDAGPQAYVCNFTYKTVTN